MISVIITGTLSALCLVLSAILLSGHGAGMIAGYNTAAEKEKAKFDEKKLCRAAGTFMLFVTIAMAALCCAGYFVETGKANENMMAIPIIIFIILLVAGIVILNIYTTKKCKK